MRRPPSAAFVAAAPPRMACLFHGCALASPSARTLLCRRRRCRRTSSTSSTPAAVSTTTPAFPSMSLAAVADAVRSGTTSAADTLSETLRRVALLEPKVAAFVSLDVDAAHAQACAVDAGVAAGNDPGPLAGVPVAVKDNICTKGCTTTGGSRILDGFVPPYDATVVARLRKAGAVILGKTNMDEFGMGSSSENSAYGITRNPFDLDCVPGGSSGGSAAAVAAGLCTAALGTDTGGSVRQPAAFCNVVGLRPSYGRVSRHGLLSYASSLDTIGPIGRTVADVARVLTVIAGGDGFDATAVDAPVPDYVAALRDDLPDGLRVGVMSQAFGGGLQAEVGNAVRTAIADLEKLGAKIEEVKLPRLDDAVTAAYFIIALSEASANLARYDGIRYGVRELSADNCTDLYLQSRSHGLGTEVRRRVMAGTFALSTEHYDEYYKKAQRARRVMANGISDIFASGVDVLLAPTAPSPPFKFGELVDDPIAMILEDLLQFPASLAGIPALSMQCGLSSTGLPIGFQLMGPFLSEEKLFQVGHAFQQATTHHLRTPDLVEDLMAASV